MSNSAFPLASLSYAFIFYLFDFTLSFFLSYLCFSATSPHFTPISMFVFLTHLSSPYTWNCDCRLFVFMWIIFTSPLLHIYSVQFSYPSFLIHLNFSPLFCLRVKFNFFYLLRFLSFTWFTLLVVELPWRLPYSRKNRIFVYSPALLYNPRYTFSLVNCEWCAEYEWTDPIWCVGQNES